MKKITISSNLLGLQWQHGIYDRNFKQVFLTIMFCLYSVSKNSKIIQTCMFSEIVRPKMGLIDPSPFNETLTNDVVNFEQPVTEC